jgi:inner membrane protein
MTRRSMPTIGHLALGLAAGRLQPDRRYRARRLVLYALLAACPDLDLVPYLLGRGELVPLGHRGATHSLAFAAAVAAVVALAWPGASRRRTFLFAFLATVSHALVDPLSAGSYGPALLWPFSSWRFTWRGFQPIPETPIGPELLQLDGFLHLALEAAIFAPLALYALWPERRRALARLRLVAWLPLRTARRHLPTLRASAVRELRVAARARAGAPRAPGQRGAGRQRTVR